MKHPYRCWSEGIRKDSKSEEKLLNEAILLEHKKKWMLRRREKMNTKSTWFGDSQHFPLKETDHQSYCHWSAYDQTWLQLFNNYPSDMNDSLHALTSFFPLKLLTDDPTSRENPIEKEEIRWGNCTAGHCGTFKCHVKKQASRRCEEEESIQVLKRNEISPLSGNSGWESIRLQNPKRGNKRSVCDS